LYPAGIHQFVKYFRKLPLNQGQKLNKFSSKTGKLCNVPKLFVGACLQNGFRVCGKNIKGKNLPKSVPVFVKQQVHDMQVQQPSYPDDI
jgi:hypothetical protein